MDSEEKIPQTECIEHKLKELREQIRKLERENEELFESLGISAHQVQDILNDKNRFSSDAYEFIQREREALEAVLEKRLEDVRANHYKEYPPEDPKIGGHWIFVR